MACMCGAEEEVDTGPIPGVAGEYTLTAPAGRLGLIFQEVSDPSGEYRHVVARLGDNSQMAGQIEAGDVIMYINAGAASHLNHTMITKQLPSLTEEPSKTRRTTRRSTARPWRRT